MLNWIKHEQGFFVDNIVSTLKQFAHGGAEEAVNAARSAAENINDVQGNIGSATVRVTLIAGAIVILLAVVSAFVKDRWPRLKAPLFITIAAVVAFTTLFMAGSTVYLNTIADSGGPVHWHADYEVWACDNQLDVRDPQGRLSNKTGSSALHEHEDGRIHLEGVVIDAQTDPTLGRFFNIIGGNVSSTELTVPLNPEGVSVFEQETDGDGPADRYASLVDPYIITQSDGDRYAHFTNGNKCGDKEAYVQTFVYKYNQDTDTYYQEKITDPASYAYSQESTVPPGDCIIIEFDVLKDQTDKLCEQYGIRDVDRCEEFGVPPDSRAICKAKQINYPASDPNKDKLAPRSAL